MKVIFQFEKATKNTVRFTEVKNEEDEAMVGTLYIPKGTLGKIKWTDGKKIIVELKTEE